VTEYEKHDLIAERNRIARELADLRDQHEALKAKFNEFAETCTTHSADRSAEQVAAQVLAGRVTEIAFHVPDDAKARLEAAVRDYTTALVRIEGL
jgi:prefoldin subunit 5